MLRHFTKMNQPGILSCPMHYSLTVMAIYIYIETSFTSVR